MRFKPLPANTQYITGTSTRVIRVDTERPQATQVPKPLHISEPSPVPIAIGPGEGSELWRGLGTCVAWGLSVSTLITLVIVPVMYAVFAGNGLKKKRKAELKAMKALAK